MRIGLDHSLKILEKAVPILNAAKGYRQGMITYLYAPFIMKTGVR